MHSSSLSYIDIKDTKMYLQNIGCVKYTRQSLTWRTIALNVHHNLLSYPRVHVFTTRLWISKYFLNDQVKKEGAILLLCACPSSIQASKHRESSRLNTVPIYTPVLGVPEDFETAHNSQPTSIRGIKTCHIHSQAHYGTSNMMEKKVR
jgi:hypothetical protein